MAGDPLSTVGSFGSALRHYRAAANLTQEMLAERAGLSVDAIGMLERGVRRSPRPATVDLLARALCLDPAQRTKLVVAARSGSEPAQTAGADPVPEPGAGIPPNPTAYFVGRESELRQLGDGLRRRGHVAVHGLGGVGKTQLAARYARDHRDRYPDGVFWLRAERESFLVADLASLAWRLRLPEQTAPDWKYRIDAVLRWLQEHPRWLLVLDNLEPAATGARSRWLPAGLPGDVLTTSRTPLPPPHLALESFPKEVAYRYLLERTSAADRRTAAAVAETLGRLPLALAQAAAYLDQTGGDLAGYAKLLDGHLVELMAEGHPDDYPQSVVATLTLSLRSLEAERPVAVALLRLCAFLAGDDIPIGLLQAGADDVAAPLGAALGDDMETDRTVAALRRYSLIERQGDGLRMHRMVQAIVRESLPPCDRPAWLASSVRLLEPYFPTDVDEHPELWAQCTRLLPHARLVQELTAVSPVEPAALVGLLSGVGTYLWSQGDYDEAGRALQRAATIASETWGADHPLTVRCFQGLGVLRWYQGDLAQARTLLEGLVASMDQSSRVDEQILGTVLHNLATVVQVQGDLVAALPLYERALALRRRVLGPEHPHTVYTLTNYGTLLRDQRDFTAARPLLEQALAIRARILGPDHPDTAHSLSNLGLLMLEQENLDAAEQLFTRAVAIRAKVLGADHDRTARSRYHLALVIWRKGDHQAARRLMRQAAENLNRRLGAHHRWTVEAERSIADMTAAGTDDRSRT